MKKIFAFILSAFLLFSCKTVKHNIRETYTERKETVTEVKEESTQKETVQITENRFIDEFENIFETIEVIKFSQPDSAGVQFIVEKMTMNRDISKGKKETSLIELSAEKETESARVKNSYELTEIEAEFIDKTVIKKTTPGWVVMGGVIAIIGIFTAIFILFKKYRIL